MCVSSWQIGYCPGNKIWNRHNMGVTSRAIVLITARSKKEAARLCVSSYHNIAWKSHVPGVPFITVPSR